MPRVAIRPSRQLADLLRRRRQELRLTLRQAEEKTRSFGKLIPFSTLGKVEQGKVDPGVLRLQQLLRIYDIPAAVALDLVDVENLSAEAPRAGEPRHLLDEALRLWKAGEVGKALAHMHALRTAVAGRPELTALRQRAQHQFAVQVAGLGRYNLSKDLLEQLLCEPLPDRTLVRVLIQLARCWKHLGSTELALAMLDRAETKAAGEPQVQAWIAHQRALVHLDLQSTKEARQEIERALKLYRAADDAYGACKATCTLSRVLAADGQPREGLKAALRVVELAREHGFERVRIEAGANVGRAYLDTGQVDEAIATLHQALADAVKTDNMPGRYFAHHNLALAYRRAGQPDRAEVEEASAQHYAKYLDSRPEHACVEIPHEDDEEDAAPPARRAKQKRGR